MTGFIQWLAEPYRAAPDALNGHILLFNISVFLIGMGIGGLLSLMSGGSK